MLSGILEGGEVRVWIQSGVELDGLIDASFEEENAVQLNIRNGIHFGLVM